MMTTITNVLFSNLSFDLNSMELISVKAYNAGYIIVTFHIYKK